MVMNLIATMYIKTYPLSYRPTNQSKRSTQYHKYNRLMEDESSDWSVD